MTLVPSLWARGARLSSGVILLFSLVLPMHGAGHALHGMQGGHGNHGEDTSAAHHAPTGDSHPGAPASCCTGPCVCPPHPSGPSVRSVVLRLPIAPLRPPVRGRATQAPVQAPIPHVLPFSTAPPARV